MGCLWVLNRLFTYLRVYSIFDSLTLRRTSSGTLDTGYEVTGMEVKVPEDACGVPGGDSSTCKDKCGVVNGDGASCADVCGVPNGDGKSCLDACGVRPLYITLI